MAWKKNYERWMSFLNDYKNAGGRVGAWIADLMLYLFGLSAYWWVALCGVAAALLSILAARLRY